MTSTFTGTIPSPAGPFTIVTDADGAVVASGWTDDLGALLLPAGTDPVPRNDVGPASAAARAYFDGDLAAIDAVTVRQHHSGLFLAHAWDVLRAVKPGEPVTYQGFAELSGRPAAVRAAAQACARNAAALFVPCHRVIRTDGSLGGFRWGLPVKAWLLEFESRKR
ncbi:methylated-DNA--[protein]-cysteine S-methyltransferase [Luedemannella helvata]|uniref:Methylated-DNA--[protein]-cysteine S-methyltransferase n=1 Tax=Luedemannella helvata TaxID=349315 RepID=A0ABP4WV28_9ACTN